MPGEAPVRQMAIVRRTEDVVKARSAEYRPAEVAPRPRDRQQQRIKKARSRRPEVEEQPRDPNAAIPWILGAAVIAVLFVVIAGVILHKVTRKEAGADGPVAAARTSPPANRPVPADPPAVPFGEMPPPQNLPGPVVPAPAAPLEPPLPAAPVPEVKRADPPPAEPAAPPLVVERPREPAPREPGARGDSGLSPQVREKVRNATVYIKVTMPDGSQASGSGFFGLEDFALLTNAHVVGMLSPESRPPTKIEVVLHSGEKNEQTLDARVVGVDRSSDLAMLRVSATRAGQTIPPPLDVRPAKSLEETDQVYIFGFPLGSRLGKEISVRPSTVTSFRHNAQGSLDKVQLEGGMDHGNSGGPVVNRSGEVVGVAVSGVQGTALNFAVPGEQVKSFVSGRIAEMSVGQAYVQNREVVVPITIRMIDPLNKVREVALAAWTGDPADPRAAGDQPAATVATDSPHQKTVLSYQNGEAKGEVRMPALDPGKVYWVQPSWAGDKGQRRWAAATVHNLAVPPIERRPVLLASRPRAGARDLTISSTDTQVISDREGGEHSLAFTVEAALRENVAPRANLIVTALTYNQLHVKMTVDGKEPPDEIRKMLQDLERSMTRLQAALVQDKQGNVVQDRKPDTQNVPAEAQEFVKDMHEEVQRSLETLSIPLPDAQVNPNRQWVAQHRFSKTVSSARSKQQQQVDAIQETTYTYLGTCKRDGRDVAVIGIQGRIHGEGAAERLVSGTCSGSAVVDIATGVTVKAELKQRFDLTTNKQRRSTGNFEFRLQRSGV
jgi:S1-C subfamily serine protease